ncbi:glycosyltransferase [Galbibacter marinus]|uniref:Glycosyltransferase n=1 Tax=Galbibacter marinus TaxID=555500 RepID=K2P488_9FLAO|nr:glycosyltransferase family 2 protein [Galbibacter marinus]EKF55823.1 glycosyltransferase [Galbibacter marinus]
MRYYVVIPAHNEAGFIEKTLQSLVDQSLLPVKVIVVNDHSTDTTEQLIDQYIEKHAFFTKLNTQSSEDHMPGSKVVNAFNKGLALLDQNYDFIVKLDADIILPKTYFEKIAAVFTEDPQIGITGGFAYEQDQNGRWLLNHPMGKDHIRGAFKAYRKEAFSAINGLRCAMGWDTLDELLVRYHGYRVQSIESLKVKHLRPTGGSYNKKARLLQGKAMYTMGYGLSLTMIASLKMALMNKKPRVFIDNLQGFFKAKNTQTPLIVSNQEATFIRTYRWRKIKSKIGLN